MLRALFWVMRLGGALGNCLQQPLVRVSARAERLAIFTFSGSCAEAERSAIFWHVLFWASVRQKA